MESKIMTLIVMMLEIIETNGNVVIIAFKKDKKKLSPETTYKNFVKYFYFIYMP